MIALPLTPFAWSMLAAAGFLLAGLGYEYRRCPIFAEPTHWTNNAAYAVMCCGRAVVFLAVALAVGGQIGG